MPRDARPRFQGKTFLLTYARAERIESKEQLHDWLLTYLPTKLITCREEHQDGGVHYHACIQFAIRQDFRDERRFDFLGHHPNMQTARAPKRAVAYVAKEGDYINVGWEVEQEMEDVFAVLAEELEAGTNATQIIGNTVARTGTRGLRLYNQIAGYTDRMLRPSAKHEPIKAYPDDFRIVDPFLLGCITAFIADMAVGRAERGERRSLWLHGPSRMGKTVLARSLGTHWYMGGGWNVDNFDDEADYGVLDDLTWEQLKYNYKGMLGLQLDVVVTDKYRKKSNIKGGRPVIVCTNTLPDFTAEEWAWLGVNVNFVAVGARLF